MPALPEQTGSRTRLASLGRMARIGGGSTHAEEHGDGFVDWQGVKPAIVAAPVDEGGNGDRDAGRKLDAELMQNGGVEGALRCSGIEVDLNSADVGLLCDGRNALRGFGDHFVVGREVGCGLDANNRHQPGVAGKLQRLASRADLHAFAKQEFAGEKSDPLFFVGSRVVRFSGVSHAQSMVRGSCCMVGAGTAVAGF